MTTADITLTGPTSKTFSKQQIEIEGEPRTVKQGVDGGISTAGHPAKVTWYGGSLADVAEITDVKIVSQGRVLIDGAFNTFNHQPKVIDGGVAFYVLEGN